jgi:ABC-type branched-subunit amino acid transport system ATPase component
MAYTITRLTPLPLSIATLALSGVLEIILREGGSFTGGYIGISGIPGVPFAESHGAIHLMYWGVVVVVLLVYGNLMDSAFGRAINAARHNSMRAAADGVNVRRLLATFFALSAGLAGLAGWLYAHYITYVSPDSLTIVTSITVLLMAVVGGADTVIGPVIGAALLMLLSSHLPASQVQGMVYGGVLVCALLLAPRGITGFSWRAVTNRLTKAVPHSPKVRVQSSANPPAKPEVPVRSPANPPDGTGRSLVAREIEVRFGGVVALRDVSFTLNPGRIVAIIGPNGSGKTTLFNAISGLARLEKGDVLLDGHSLRGVQQYKRVAHGIARTFQTPRVDPRITVKEAVLCGLYPRSTTTTVDILLRTRKANRQENEVDLASEETLRDFELFTLKDHSMGELPMGLVRIVDVARAVASCPKFLLLDEPAAGLTRAEQTMLARQISKLAAQGVGVLLVEHNFALVRSLAHETIVLNRGCELLRGQVSEIERDPRFIQAYLGARSARERPVST